MSTTYVDNNLRDSIGNLFTIGLSPLSTASNRQLTAKAHPPSLFDIVTASAIDFTSGLAFPIATENPHSLTEKD